MGNCPFSALLNQKGAIKFFSRNNSHPHSQKNVETTNLGPTNINEVAFSSLKNGEDHKRMSFIKLTEEDVKNLVAIRPIIEKNIVTVVDKFYENILQQSHLMSIVTQHSTIERLKKTFRQYVLDMVSGEIGPEYIKRRRVVGHVHNRIGLFPQWYLGAYSLLQQEIHSLLTNELPSKEEVDKYYYSFNKLCSFDMQIGIETYIEAFTASMMKMNEIKEFQTDLNDSASLLAASVEETSASIEDKEKIVSQMLEEIFEIQSSSKEMIQHVNDGAKEVNTALQEVEQVIVLVDETKKLTKELSESSDQIGAVVSTIRGISNQTNILSLNAAIEAARAGEHGKGFSIVAQEVRKLASQTEAALDHIQKQISTVQSTVDTFETSYASIVSAIEKYIETSKNIIKVFEQSKEGITHNDSKIGTFNEYVNHFQRAFEEISDASSEIAAMAERLSEMNNELTVKINS